MSVYFTSAEDIVDPAETYNVKTAPAADLKTKLFFVKSDIEDLEVLIRDLKDHLADVKTRLSKVEEELDEREDADTEADAAEVE
jgi:hypothetical protein